VGNLFLFHLLYSLITSSPLPQSAGTALSLFKNNPADELSSEAEQLIRHP